MKKYFFSYRTVIILILACLLSSLFFLSINQYKVSFLSWQDRLVHLRLVAHELDVAMHKVHSGVRFDYDQITSKELQLKKAVAALTGNLKNQNDDSPYLARVLSINQHEIVLSVEPLEALCSEASFIVETFKTSFAKLRNSQLIVFQLVADIQPELESSPNLSQDVSRLERSLLRLMQFGADNYQSEVRILLSNIKQGYSSPQFQSVKRFVGFVDAHVGVISTNAPIIESSFNKAEMLQERAYGFIDSLEEELRNQYGAEVRRSTKFSYFFLLTAFVVLGLGVNLSRKTYLLRNQLAVHNKNLEHLVSQRTANLEITKTRLQSEKNEREELLNQLDESKNQLDAIINTIHGCVYEYDAESGKFQYISNGVEDIWGERVDSLTNIEDLIKMIHPDDVELRKLPINALNEKVPVANMEYRIVRGGGNIVWARELCSAKLENGVSKSLVGVVVDISEFKQASQERMSIEKELVHAQKLESVGHLAAGIAHEVNTPAQFISDNLMFLKDSVGEVLGLTREIRGQVKKNNADELSCLIDDLCEDADLDYLESEIMPALTQSYDGITSIAKIIRAMKDYSHPGETIELADLNKAIESTVTISRSEWKYFAVLETEFEEQLPMVECVVSDINQTVLNMIVNAAHAIVEKYDDPDNLEGRILIRTKSLGDHVAIEVGDNGNGMPEDVKAKIFDHFFTTKGVGKGTGQGLSLAYRMIVDKHGGKIEVDSAEGVGTTFRILLPVKHCEPGK